jgi:hypothetical protein
MGSPRVAPEPSAGLELSNLQEASEAGGSESSGRASLCRKARPTCGWAQPHPTRSFGRGWPYLGAAVGILSPVLLLKLRSLPSTQGPCLRPTGPRKVGKEGSRRYDLLHLPAHRTTTPTSTSTLHLELHFHTSNPRMPFRDRKDSTYSYVEEDGGPTAAPTLLCSSLHPAHPCASTTPSSVRCTPFEAYRSPSPSQPASAQP